MPRVLVLGSFHYSSLSKSFYSRPVTEFRLMVNYHKLSFRNYIRRNEIPGILTLITLCRLVCTKVHTVSAAAVRGCCYFMRTHAGTSWRPLI